MPNPQVTVVEVLMRRVAGDLLSTWTDLVNLGYLLVKEKTEIAKVAETLAKASRSGVESIKRKLLAVQYMSTLGFTPEDVVAAGQEQVLSQYQQDKRAEKYEKRTPLRFWVPGSQRELVQLELARVAKVCGFKGSEQTWDFLLAQLRNTTEEELKHAAGVKQATDTHENIHPTPPAHPGSKD